MSFAEAAPDSSIRTAEMRYGTSSAMTTKPERSRARTTVLPSCPEANAAARSVTSSEVS